MGYRRDTDERMVRHEYALDDHQAALVRLDREVKDQKLEIEDLWEEDESNYSVLIDCIHRTDEVLLHVSEVVLKLTKRLVALEKAQADTDLLTKLTASVVSTERKRESLIQSRTCDCCKPKAPEPEVQE